MVVAEDFLEGRKRDTLADRVYRECLPQDMWRGLAGDAGALGDAADNAVERPDGDTERVVDREMALKEGTRATRG